MRVCKTKFFVRFARNAGLEDKALCKAVKDIERGLIDADLGGGVIKQRIARPGQGKSGGFRTVLLYKKQTVAFFVYGFAKNERDNIRDDELREFKILAADSFAYDARKIEHLLETRELTEVIDDEKTLP